MFSEIVPTCCTLRAVLLLVVLEHAGGVAERRRARCRSGSAACSAAGSRATWMSGTFGCGLSTLRRTVVVQRERADEREHLVDQVGCVSFWFWLQFVPESAKSMLTRWPQRPPLVALTYCANATAPCCAPCEQAADRTGAVGDRAERDRRMLVRPTSVPLCRRQVPLLPGSASRSGCCRGPWCRRVAGRCRLVPLVPPPVVVVPSVVGAAAGRRGAVGRWCRRRPWCRCPSYLTLG